jgi:rod shape-determining protein MreD
MPGNRPHYILLPVSPLFITFSLVCAFMLNLMPWGRWLGAPDFVALVLVFWGIHQPRKVGIGVAFCMGLLMDVHDASLLGENALAYTLLSYFAIMIHRRVLWFPTLTQAMHVFPLLLMAQAIQLIVHRERGGGNFVARNHLAAAGAPAPRGRPRPHPSDLTDLNRPIRA